MNSDLSAQNSSFWSEPCGTQLASSLGLSGKVDSNSLDNFDKKYFSLYPYLLPFLSDIEFKSSSVLEIGLGMGSLSQWLASRASIYTALDIAKGPTEIVNLRLKHCNKSQSACQGSILSAPFSDNSFDCIITIGCLHHTGDLKLALDECHRLLRPGGKLKMMVYYAYSARRWASNPLQTLNYLVGEVLGNRTVVDNISQFSRSSYDTNSHGQAAPHTDFISRKSFCKLADNFSNIQFSIMNFEREGIWKLKSRDYWLSTKIPSYLGLDLYVTLEK